MSKIRNLFLVMLVAFQFACATATIMNLENQPISDGISQDQFQQVVMTAAANRGWVFQSMGPDVMLGTLNVRSHTARVEIYQTARTYSIRYKDSVNLDHNGNQIHGNYNRWVANLNQDIRMEMQRVSAASSGAPTAVAAPLPSAEPAEPAAQDDAADQPAEEAAQPEGGVE